MGFGLVIASNLAECIGGTIGVAAKLAGSHEKISLAPDIPFPFDQGSIFTLKVPLKISTGPPPSESPISTSPTLSTFNVAPVSPTTTAIPFSSLNIRSPTSTALPPLQGLSEVLATKFKNTRILLVEDNLVIRSFPFLVRI